MAHNWTPLTLRTLSEMLDRLGVRYEAEGAYLRTSFEGVRLAFAVDEARQVLLLLIPVSIGRGMPGSAAELAEEEQAAAAYMLAANYRMLVGRFERDHTDGETRFTLSIPLLESVLTEMQLKYVIVAAVAAVQMHVPVIAALLLGQITLRRALEMLDHDDFPPAMTA